MGVLDPPVSATSGAATPSVRSSPPVRRFSRPRSAIFLLFALAAASAAVPDRDRPTGFSIDLRVASDKLLQVVRQVANDRTIRGTYQYDKETTLTGASSDTSSDAFEPWNGPGQVFYKVKHQTVAPAHFPDSGDIGTVTVRYIVQPLGPEGTRLRIDAVFIAEGRHQRHISDGSVETTEFAEIAQKLQDLQEQEKEAERQAQNKAQEQQQNELRNSLEEENSRLEAATTSLQQLQQRKEELRREVLARAKLSGVPLKTAPFNHAATLRLLPKGTVVTIVMRTPYWYGVLGPQAQRGWVYHLLLEAVP